MRKKEDPSTRLDSSLTMKVTATERSALEIEAAASGMSASALLRRKLLENRSIIQALPKTNLEAVQYLRCYLRLTNGAESVLHAAAVSMALGETEASDYQRLVFALDRVIAAFRWEIGHAA